MNSLIKKIVGSVIAIIPVVLIISGILFGFNILSILQFFLLPGIVILTLFNLYLFFRVDGKSKSNLQQKKESKQNNASNNQTGEAKKQDEQTGNKEQENKKEKNKEAEKNNEQDSKEKVQSEEKKEVKGVTIEQNQNEGEQAKEEQNEDEKTLATEKMIKVIKPKKLESYFQSSKENQNNQEDQLEQQDSSKTEINSGQEDTSDVELLEKARELGPKGWSAITMGATSLISLIVKIIKEKRKNKN
ncbi:hypothetical protein SAMN04488698_101307 [Candidatus Frackibacter sp. WG12]|uniref:DUF3784 domain-containing protein n=1 Tax=unclassified Candidatus Frackibacter TaxID=2648818 RepID=UPI00079B322E|nr:MULTISPECIES: DUF3784 domain-containing protein [unclassified Candidatus Frackibacter]KXS43665.1 MAG: hypothetical protein AWU54_956 [Candidatus Frackibacter sp. T328-2]SDC01964.1 hypothetical protein SAMN04515661_101307 [Candidatus Frackibacter sp. WG11]SEM33168.1 hypothetical protein SAMN04488698_101307 [Candidatus Frackibacter sp. WG12]